MPNTGTNIWEGVDAQGTSTASVEATYLPSGVYWIEIVNDPGSATVRIQCTTDPDADDWKNEAELTDLSSSKKGEMMRGGRYVRAIVETDDPTEAIDIVATKASN